MSAAVPPRAVRWLSVSAGAAAAGALIVIGGLLFARDATGVAYLAGYSAVLTIVIGMLLLAMIAHVSGAVWFVLLRRQAEAVTGALPVLAVFTLPVLDVHQSFVLLRTLVYWAVWIGVGESLYRMSRRQDIAKDALIQARYGVMNVAGIPMVALALNFAAFDWMMRLSPGWSSTLYGGYVFASAMTGALGLLAVMAFAAATPTSQHFQAIGRLTLAFVLLWAYLWYCQFFIIWIADIPREVPWVAVRFSGGWRAAGRLLVVAAFVLPFLALMFRAARGSARIMCGIGVWLLAAHCLDTYWLLLPSVRPVWSVSDLLLSVGATLLVGGTSAAAALWRSGGVPAAVITDPNLVASLEYQAH